MNSNKIKQVKRKLRKSKRHLDVHFRKSTSPDGLFDIFDGRHGEVLVLFCHTNKADSGDMIDGLSDAANNLGYHYEQPDRQHCLIKGHEKLIYFDVREGRPIIIAYPPMMSPALRDQAIEQIYERNWF